MSRTKGVHKNELQTQKVTKLGFNKKKIETAVNKGIDKDTSDNQQSIEDLETGRFSAMSDQKS